MRGQISREGRGRFGWHARADSSEENKRGGTIIIFGTVSEASDRPISYQQGGKESSTLSTFKSQSQSCFIATVHPGHEPSTATKPYTGPKCADARGSSRVTRVRERLPRGVHRHDIILSVCVCLSKHTAGTPGILIHHKRRGLSCRRQRCRHAAVHSRDRSSRS